MGGTSASLLRERCDYSGKRVIQHIRVRHASHRLDAKAVPFGGGIVTFVAMLPEMQRQLQVLNELLSNTTHLQTTPSPMPATDSRLT
jgi:hypothetical protein